MKKNREQYIAELKEMTGAHAAASHISQLTVTVDGLNQRIKAIQMDQVRTGVRRTQHHG